MDFYHGGFGVVLRMIRYESRKRKYRKNEGKRTENREEQGRINNNNKNKKKKKRRDT